MSLTVYNGAPGSGKSFEVVKSVILPAIQAGRRVLTNIDGISSERVRDFCVEEYGCELEKLGTIVLVKQGDILSSDFFPHVVDSAIVPGQYIVRPGDLVCVDEGYKFWKTKLLAPHLVFFREHRHFAEAETGYTCDIVIMTQSFGDLHRDVRAIVEQSYITHKAKAIRDDLYTIKQFEGNRQLKATFIQDWTKLYDPKIFPLYKSYFGGKGKEVSVDSRQRFFSKKIIFKIILLLGFSGSCIYYFVHSFYQKGHPADSTLSGSASIPSPPGPQAALPRSLAAQAGTAASPVQDPRAPSSDLRIIGSFVVRGRRTVLLSNAAGRLRFEPSDSFTGEGALEATVLDGAKVGPFSGQLPQVSSGGVKP